MADYKLGDIVALTAGSPRMAVEQVEGETVSTVWCNEGTIHRDTFNEKLIKKWEVREGGGDRGGYKGGGDRGGYKGGGDRGGFGGGDRGGYKGGGDRGGDRGGYKGGGKPYGGDRDGGSKSFSDRGGDDRGAPKGKPGWDGKPREKKFFRKD